MATTVQAADLQVTITESYSLNGVSYGNTVNKIYSSNGEIVQRVMAIQSQGRGANWTDILNFGAADSAGQVDVSNYKYFRITNLDDTNFLELRITGVLSELVPITDITLINEQENLFVKNIGEKIENDGKNYKQIFANSWIYNTGSRFRVEISGSTFKFKTLLDKSSLKVVLGRVFEEEF